MLASVDDAKPRHRPSWGCLSAVDVLIVECLSVHKTYFSFISVCTGPRVHTVLNRWNFGLTTRVFNVCVLVLIIFKGVQDQGPVISVLSGDCGRFLVFVGLRQVSNLPLKENIGQTRFCSFKSLQVLINQSRTLKTSRSIEEN